ncbi:MAG TPA: DUF3467 domain-containing protein [Pirellulales bacterium]|nr:DUF3467 domain-containing protein [Pirellulales bacterium]
MQQTGACRAEARCQHPASANDGNPPGSGLLDKELSVAKDNEKEEAMDLKTPVPAPAAGAPADVVTRQQMSVDASKAQAAYANFCRVTGTPEELIIDFGLNTQPMGAPTEPIQISERIVMNYYTAKRMLSALQMSLQRHEAAFGVLETDVQKRVMPGIMRPAPTTPR